MRKLILLASLPAMAVAQEVSPAEFLAQEYLSIPVSPKHVIVIRDDVKNSGTPADGTYIIGSLCRKMKGKEINLLSCTKNNLTIFEDDLLVNLDRKIGRCNAVNGTYSIKVECEKDGKIIARALEGKAGYQTTMCGQWSCTDSGTQVTLIEVEDTKGISSFEAKQDIKKWTSLEDMAKGFLGLKQKGPVIGKNVLHTRTQGFEFLFQIANICRNQGGKFYAKGVSFETYILGALAGSVTKRFNQFAGVYSCEGGNEPFTAYVTEEPLRVEQRTISELKIRIVKTYDEKDTQEAREQFLKAYKPAIEKLLAKYPLIAQNEMVKKDLESYIAQEPQTSQTPQTQPIPQAPQAQAMPPAVQPSPIQGGPGYEIAQRAAQEGRPITVREGYTMWVTRIVEKDTRGCTRVEVAKINLAAPPGTKTVPETWTYTFCQGQAESIGKPKYLQIPPQAKEMGQQIAGFCQRYGSATGKWNDIEINCRALRDKDQCLVEITYFDVVNQAFVGSETINGCR